MPGRAAQLTGRLAARIPLLATSGAVLGTTAISAAFGLLFWMSLSRNAPTGQVGQVAIVVAVAGISSLLATAGAGPALMLALPAAATPDRWSAARTAIAGTSLLAALIAAAAVALLPVLSSEFTALRSWPLALGAVLAAAGAAGGAAADAAAVGLARPSVMPTRHALFSAGKLAGLWAGILLSAAMLGATAAWAAAAAGSVAWAWHVLARREAPPSTARAGWNVIAPGLAHHHLSSLGAALPPLLLPLLVTARLGVTDTAVFSLTWSIALMFFAVAPAVAAAVLAHAGRPRHAAGHAARLTAALIAGPIVLALAFPGWLLSWFGPQYSADGATLLRLLAIAAIPDAALTIAVALARRAGRLTLVTWLSVAVGVAVLAGSWLLMPALGVAGVGWAWMAAQAAGATAIGLALAIPAWRSSQAPSTGQASAPHADPDSARPAPAPPADPTRRTPPTRPTRKAA